MRSWGPPWRTGGHRSRADSRRLQSLQVIAHYLPQFHPIPENDEWWGTGFTEWTNVTKARPLFRGHVQPHLPADLGLLRPAGARGARGPGRPGPTTTGSPASATGTTGSAGQRLLERPFDEVLASGTPDFPFCLAWANQTWSGIWHGAPDRILIEQTYPGPEDDAAPLRLPADGVRGRPLHPGRRPTAPLHLQARPTCPSRPGFVERWQAHGARGRLRRPLPGGRHGRVRVPAPTPRTASTPPCGTSSPSARTVASWLAGPADGPGLMRGPERLSLRAAPVPNRPPTWPGPVFPCVYPNWDNTPRSGRVGVLATRVRRPSASAPRCAGPSSWSTDSPRTNRS